MRVPSPSTVIADDESELVRCSPRCVAHDGSHDDCENTCRGCRYTRGWGVPPKRHVRHTSFGCHGGVQQSESSRCSSHTFETVATFCEHTCDRLCLGMLWYWRHRVFRPRHRRRLCVNILNMYVSCVLPELLARRRGVDSVHYRIFCVFARLSRLV